MGRADLAAWVWTAEESTGCSLAGTGAQQACGTGTMLVRWQNDSAGKYQPSPANQAFGIEEQHLKKDGCLSKERINSFVLDFGDVRLDPPCSLHQPCSCPLGTTGGEEEAELVLSPISLGWCYMLRECRAKTPVPGY